MQVAMEPIVQRVLAAIDTACRALSRYAASASPDAVDLLATQHALLRRAGKRLIAALSASEGAALAAVSASPSPQGVTVWGSRPPSFAQPPPPEPSDKRLRSALSSTTRPLRPRRTIRLLNELPADVAIHASLFLPLRTLGLLDITCQRYHPVGLTQKACMMRARMWPQQTAGGSRVGRPACWPRWLAERQLWGQRRGGLRRIDG